HYAMCKGDLSSEAPLVRVHLQDVFTDVLRSDRNAERSWTLEKAMKRIGEFTLVTYKDTIDNQVHYAMCKGDLSSEAPLVRVHLQDVFTDVLRSDRNAERSWTLEKAMKRIGE
ncbi:hypothetical protein REH81_37245, partial [Vibrio rotiferianus]